MLKTNPQTDFVFIRFENVCDRKRADKYLATTYLKHGFRWYVQLKHIFIKMLKAFPLQWKKKLSHRQIKFCQHKYLHDSIFTKVNLFHRRKQMGNLLDRINSQQYLKTIERNNLFALHNRRDEVYFVKFVLINKRKLPYLWCPRPVPVYLSISIFPSISRFLLVNIYIIPLVYCVWMQFRHISVHMLRFWLNNFHITTTIQHYNNENTTIIIL